MARATWEGIAEPMFGFWLHLHRCLGDDSVAAVSAAWAHRRHEQVPIESHMPRLMGCVTARRITSRCFDRTGPLGGATSPPLFDRMAPPLRNMSMPSPTWAAAESQRP
jgi:hypothetical protein